MGLWREGKVGLCPSLLLPKSDLHQREMVPLRLWRTLCGQLLGGHLCGHRGQQLRCPGAPQGKQESIKDTEHTHTEPRK